MPEISPERPVERSCSPAEGGMQAMRRIGGNLGETSTDFEVSCKKSADYPKVWPFPTKSLATQEETGESALSLRAWQRQGRYLRAFRRFCYSYGSTGQFTYVAKLSVGCGQTFG